MIFVLFELMRSPILVTSRFNLAFMSCCSRWGIQFARSSSYLRLSKICLGGLPIQSRLHVLDILLQFAVVQLARERCFCSYRHIHFARSSSYLGLWEVRFWQFHDSISPSCIGHPFAICCCPISKRALLLFLPTSNSQDLRLIWAYMKPDLAVLRFKFAIISWIFFCDLLLFIHKRVFLPLLQTYPIRMIFIYNYEISRQQLKVLYCGFHFNF